MQIDELESQPIREDPGGIEGGDEPQLDEDLAEAAAGATLDVERLRELLLRDHAVLDEQVTDAAAGRGGRRVGFYDFVNHRGCIGGGSPEIEP